MTKKAAIPTPRDPDDWLVEIALADQDAKESIPFAHLLGDRVKEEELFALAPLIALKFRGVRRTRTAQRKATDAALASFVATTRGDLKAMGNPRLAFAFWYLASHFGLGLLAREIVEETMEHLERNMGRLDSLAAPKRGAVVGED